MFFLPACLLATAPPSAGFENWVARRDAGVVRQARDYSCGLASLATLFALRGWPAASEEALLGELPAAGNDGTESRVAQRGVEDGAVFLADPSWGNRWLASWEFARRFEAIPGSGRGRLLLIARRDDGADNAAGLRARQSPVYLPPVLP